MTEFEITDAPDQQFGTILNNKRVTIRLRYNPVPDRWSLDLSIDDQPVLHGRRIVLGVNLLEPFDFDLGALFALDATPGSEPNRNGLPMGLVRLYHTTEDEIEEVLSGAVPS